MRRMLIPLAIGCSILATGLLNPLAPLAAPLPAPGLPSVTAVLPDSPSHGILTIQGSNFGSSVEVIFQSTSLTVLSQSATEITASMLPGTAPGTYRVTVSNLGPRGHVLWSDSLAVVIAPAGGQGGGTKIHASTVGGAFPYPTNPGITTQLIRSVTFAPGSGKDVLLYAEVFGRTSTTSIDATSALILRVLDADGNLISEKQVPFALGNMPPMPGSTPNDGIITPGSAIPYKIRLSLSSGRGNASFPSSSYAVQVLISTSGFTVGQIDTTQFRVYVAEGTTEDSPSGNITG
jgi:hypothetical protein